MQIIINKLSYCPYSAAQIKKIVLLAAKEEKRLRGVVEINIISAPEMKKMNRLYRGKNRPTDVLSFAWTEDSLIKSDYLGQLYLCYDKLVEQAKEFQVSVKEEFTRILVHGLLHLVGYDHQGKSEAREMFGLQEKIVDKTKN